MILNRIYKDYCLPLKLYENVKKSLKYMYNQDIDDLSKFVEELPQDLRLEVSLFIYEDTFKQVEFLKNRPVSFIAWICPLLKPLVINKDQFIYFEGDDVNCIYFLKQGHAGYVLPRHKNLMYVKLFKGCNFGASDIVGSFIENDDFDIDSWFSYKETLKR